MFLLGWISLTTNRIFHAYLYSILHWRNILYFSWTICLFDFMVCQSFYVILCQTRIFIFVYWIYFYILLYSFVLLKSLKFYCSLVERVVSFFARNYLFLIRTNFFYNSEGCMITLPHVHFGHSLCFSIKKVWISHVWPMSSWIKTTSSFQFLSSGAHSPRVDFIWKKVCFVNCFSIIVTISFDILIHHNFYIGVGYFKVVVNNHFFGWSGY